MRTSVIFLASMLLVGCATTDEQASVTPADTGSDSAMVTSGEEAMPAVECTSDNSDNPACGSGGGTSGPIIIRENSVEGTNSDCASDDPDNPQCGSGGGTSGPIIIRENNMEDMSDDCDSSDPDNPQCGSGGGTSGPIIIRENQ